MRTGFWAIAAVAFAALDAAPAASHFIVTASDGPRAVRNYPRGMRLTGDETIRLRRNESITILTGDGMRRFRGPGRVSLADARQLSGRFLLAERETEQPRAAVARMEMWPPAPDMLRPFAPLWNVELGESARICLFSEDMLVTSVPRGNWQEAESIQFRRLRDRETRHFSYDADFAQLHAGDRWLQGWPVGMTIEPGDRFEIRAFDAHRAGIGEPVTIEFVPLDIVPFEHVDPALERLPFVEQVLARYRLLEIELADKGCSGQLAAARQAIARYESELGAAVESADTESPD